MIGERREIFVVKNRSTERERAFWNHVESVAEQSRNIRGMSRPHGEAPGGQTTRNRNSPGCYDGKADLRRPEE